MKSVLFEMEIDPSYIGTIQWVCESPVRKGWKRKNYSKKMDDKEPPESHDNRYPEMAAFWEEWTKQNAAAFIFEDDDDPEAA
jgi:hypothetical protein